MTVDSTTYKQAWATGRWFMAAHGVCLKLSLVPMLTQRSVRQSYPQQSFHHLHLCLVSLIYERSQSRHALQVSQPTSKPGRPLFVQLYYNIKYNSGLCSLLKDRGYAQFTLNCLKFTNIKISLCFMVKQFKIRDNFLSTAG